MRNATPQPRSANSPRSDLGSPAQGARCSPPPASTARDSGTAPEPHAEAADPSPPQPTPIPAAAPKAAPKPDPIPTSQPPAPLDPTRYSDDSRDPGNAAQEAGSDPASESFRSSERAAMSFSRPLPLRQCQRSQSATESRERPQSGCADNSPRISDNSAGPIRRP